MDGVDVDLSGLPIGFLEAYEWPAFVLVTPLAPRTRPRLISRDTDITVRGHEDVSPLSLPTTRKTSMRIAWSNEKWQSLIGAREIEECLDAITENKFLAWTGSTDGKERVFQLSLRQPAITLNLARACVPLSPVSATHQYCVVTAQPAPAYIAPASGSESTIVSPNHRSSASTDVSYFDSVSVGFRDSFSTEQSDPTLSPSMNSTGDSVPKSSGSGRSRLRRRPQPSTGLSEVQLARAAEQCWEAVHSVDWSQTALGPRSEWASYVDPLLSVVFQSKTQDCLWLGRDLHLIYNMSYAKIIPTPGHPWSFGRKGLEVWKPIQEYIIPFFEKCFNGESIYREHDLLSYETLSTGEYCERYHTWRYNPVRKDTGEIIGVYNQSIETTEQVIAERRLNTVRDLSEHMLVARTQQQFYGSVAQVFDSNPKDAPFMLAYSVHVKNENAAAVTVLAKLESTVGVPSGHPSAPQSLYATLTVKDRAAFGLNADRLSSPTLSAISALSSGSGRVYHSSDGNSWPIARALQTRQCVIIDDCRDLIGGYPIRAWDALPHAAVVVPICQDSSIDVPDGVVIIGLSVRRPFDEAYESWAHVIRSQLASTIVSVKGFEEEARRREEADKMERAKQTWFKGAAHDLKSPLNLILGPVEDVLDSSLTQNQRVALSTAKRNVERLMRLVDSLMDFSRLEAGKVEGRFVPTDLGAFVTEVAALFRPAIERLRIDYHIDVEASDKLVFIDPLLFEKILSNMIGNALKYTERGSITVRLRYGKMAEITVTDTGVGIPQSEILQVTEWYHRATTAVHAGCQGTGLGLALVRELLTLHDGELLISSKTAAEFNGQHGSTFTATLPLAPREIVSPLEQPRAFGVYGKTIVKDAMRWTKPRHGSESESGGSDPSESWTNSTAKQSDTLLFEPSDTILVVDDNLDMRQYIKHLLSPYCTVLEAGHGVDALDIALGQKVDLIISDYMMPKMGGMELLKEIRKSEQTRIVPFIMASAVSGDEVKMDALFNGAEDYLSKPFKPKELIARAHLHLQFGKKRVQLEKLYAEQKAEVSLLSDLCPSGIMRGDLDGHVVYGNEAWRTMAGMGPEENPDNWPQYVEPSVHEVLWASWSKWLNGSDQRLTLSWKWLSGRTVSAAFIRLDLAVPGMTGILGCLTDITHEVEQLAEAEQRRIEAENAKAQQELLIDFTSHEIRGPVSSVLNSATLVKDNLASLKDSLQLAQLTGTGYIPTIALLRDLDEDIEALEGIYQCALAQERIAGDILSLARIQMDMLSLHDIDMDLRKEAKKVMGAFTTESKMKRITMALEFGPSIEQAQVYGVKTDPVRVGQVITNLLANAIRFTASSEIRRITVKIDVSFVPPADDTCGVPEDIALGQVPPAEDTPLWLFISVRDTGPGLGEKELQQLFKRFSQGNKMIHTRYGGSGLGLFICRKITELLGGRIEVRSELGVGSVFRFFIRSRAIAPPERPPLSVSALAIHDKENGQAAPPMETRSATQTTVASASSSMINNLPQTTNGMHILIVEDNLINQTVLKRQITKAGLTCDVANNGLEGLNLIREADRLHRRADDVKLYDCVLMDLEMPIMDGLTAVREIRAAEAAGTLSRQMVIALTGNARQGQIDQAMEAGMDDVVIKPYRLPNLLAKINDMAVRRASAVL